MTRTAPKTIAIAGDWHCSKYWATTCVKELATMDVDLILHVGDFGYWPKQSDYIDVLTEALDKADIELWFIDGNHEDHDTLEDLPIDETLPEDLPENSYRVPGLRPISSRIFHIPRGLRWGWDGKTWMGLGGAVSVDRRRRVKFIDWFPQEVISDEELDYALRPGKVDVMLTHDVPQGVPTIAMKFGGPSHWPAELIDLSREHAAKLWRVMQAKRPAQWFHGHFHIKYTNLHEGTLFHGLDCDSTSLSDNLTLVDCHGEQSMASYSDDRPAS